MKKIKVLGVQMKVQNSKSANLLKAEKLMDEGIMKYNPHIIALPEMFNTPYDNKFFPQFAEEENGETLCFLKEFAKTRKILIIGGSIPEKDGEKIYNTSYAISSEGEILGKHRKVHLFDIDIPGKVTFKESAVLSPGNHFTVIDTMFGKIGIAICYDLRFPEQFIEMEREGAKLMVIPGAFNLTTGPAHWELLLRTRALDQQVHVMGISPARDESFTYKAYGHSMIIGPWGDIKNTLNEEEGLLYGELDSDELTRVRREIPSRMNRRRDLY